MKRPVELTVNGVLYKLEIEPRRTLLEVIREVIGLTGTKRGCDRGNCGSCTVIMDQKPIASCLVLAVEAHGKNITTIEGVADHGHLHPLQEAFLEHGAIQCGFCTPGMVMSAKALIDNNQAPLESEIKEAISGNLCRCGGYARIVKAIASVKTNG